MDFWARWLVAAGELHTAGHPFPRDRALGEHHTSRVTRDCLCQSLFPAAQAPQRKPVHAWQQLPFHHQHQNGTELIIPSPCFHRGSPRPRRDPQRLFRVAQPETQHEDFNSRRQQCDLQKKDPKNPTPQTIRKCRLHTLSTTSTFIGNILPIQYGNGDTCFHEAVLVLESTQRATFHEEDGIVLDCLN